MVALLPPDFTPKILHKNTPPSTRTLMEHDAVIIVIERDDALRQLRRCPHAKLAQQLYERAQRRGKVNTLRLHDPDTGNLLVLGFAAINMTRFEQLSFGAKLWKEIEPCAAAKVALATLGFVSTETDAWLNALLAAVLAGAAPLPSYKSNANTTPQRDASAQRKLAAISLLNEHAVNTGIDNFAVSITTQAGNHLARWLTTLPPNILNCGSYRIALQQLAKRHGWQARFFDQAALKRFKAGAFLAVARANTGRAAGIMHLRYTGAGNKQRVRPKLSLVGKGICFDTGGINLKSHKSMYDMHTDMQGSAVAVGTLLALTQLKVPFAVDCWLALTENEIGPNAYRPQEVVTACNGVTIQVVHSDAEGRMALADTLALAAREEPQLMIDFATLTGACVTALSDRMSGAFSNRAELRDGIEDAGNDSGERVWSFPMHSDYDADLDSPLADIMQCTMDSKGDHILAARFLSRFVPAAVPWVHVDLSAASRHGGLAHIGTEITGFGVRWAVAFANRQFGQN